MEETTKQSIDNISNLLCNQNESCFNLGISLLNQYQHLLEHIVECCVKKIGAKISKIKDEQPKKIEFTINYLNIHVFFLTKGIYIEVTSSHYHDFFCLKNNPKIAYYKLFSHLKFYFEDKLKEYNQA